MNRVEGSHTPRGSAKDAAKSVAMGFARRKLQLATAESCTGGMIGALLTGIPGSSSWYQGGVISYANHAKTSLLGVSTQTLEQSGAVSEATAIEMAVGARKRLDSDLALSVTGIAGPAGGSVSKPVGTVWIGIASPRRAYARHYRFDGSRRDVRLASATQALTMLIEELSALESDGIRPQPAPKP